MNLYLSVVEGHPSIATGLANVPAPATNFSPPANGSLSSTRLGIPENPQPLPKFIQHLKMR